MCVCVCVCAYIYIYFITDHTLSSIIRSNSKSPNQGLQSRKKPKYLYFPYNSSYFINWVKDNNPNYPNPNFASKSRWKNKFSTLNSQTKKKKNPLNAGKPKANHSAIATQNTKADHPQPQTKFHEQLKWRENSA